jgi:small-conductance mechanosensitive channel
MELFGNLLAFARPLLPFLATLAVVTAVLATAHTLLNRRYGDYPQARFRVQLVLLTLTLVGVLAVTLTLTRDDAEMRGQLLSFLGILLSAAIALSSTTFLGNALAGILLRVVAGFRIGDFIRVGDDFGRVSERSLLHTEIQTEDRNLTTLPNLYLVTNPVRVVRSSGTIISATVSLGYDVPRSRIEQALLDAANTVGLDDPFVQVLELGDFSVTYRISGLLTEVKQLLSTRSDLRGAVLDSLHGAGIEIVSPTFMNTRSLDPELAVLPPYSPAREKAGGGGSRAPEDVVFDKAEEAEKIAGLTARRKRLEEEIELLESEAKKAGDDRRKRVLELRIGRLSEAHSELGGVIDRARAKSADR